MTSFKPLKRQVTATAVWLTVLGGCALVAGDHSYHGAGLLFSAWLLEAGYRTLGRYRHGYRTTLTDEGIEIHGRRFVPVPWTAVRSIEIKQHVFSAKLYVHFGEDRKVLLPAPYTGFLFRRDKDFPSKVKAIQTAYAEATGQMPKPPQRIAQG